MRTRPYRTQDLGGRNLRHTRKFLLSLPGRAAPLPGLRRPHFAGRPGRDLPYSDLSCAAIRWCMINRRSHRVTSIPYG